MASTGVNVLRWSALGLGVFYGIYHQASISARDRLHQRQQDYTQKQSLITQAKRDYQRSTAPDSENKGPVDPKEDLEGFPWLQESKQIFTRVVLRAAALASRPVLSSPISSTRLLSTKILRPARPLALSVSFQRRFASEEAAKNEEETEALEQSSAHENVAETASDPIVEAAVDSVETTSTQVIEPDTQSSTGAAAASQPPATDGEGKPVSWDLAPSNTVYVGNLFFDSKPDELKQFFGRYGSVANVDMITDIRGYSKGFAFIHFEEVADAGRAVQDAHGQVFAGRRLAVNFAAKKQQSNRAPGEPSPTLFVGNLAYDITDKELNDMFRPLRNIRDVRVAIDRRTGQPRGFAHADFTDTKSAVDAMEKLSGKAIRGRDLKVDFSVSHNTRDQAALDKANSPRQ